jgi:3-hydroxyacyl-CoA dehydrogenase / enoyl-CoA hydratase / 3-hydroxybutyryl-CoA epimerase
MQEVASPSPVSPTSAIGSASSTQKELVQLHTIPGNIALVVLGGEHERIVTLTRERMLQLQVVLAQVRDTGAAAVVFTGPRSDMFSVGADVKLIESVTDVQEGVALARLGQGIIDQITAFPFPSFACISGPCVGGAFELALACSYRLCSDHSSTLVGLPEVNLGIIPGFGGTQRLPRLIGLPSALDLILSGKTVRALEAKRLGLVDEVSKADMLLERVAALIARPVTPRTSFPLATRFLTYTSLGRRISKKRALAHLKRKVRAPYQAPFVALDTILYGLEYGLPLGLEREAKVVGELVVSPITKGLVHVFSSSEAAKGLGRVGGFSPNTHIKVVGAGIMGSGITTALVKSGFKTSLVDLDQNMLQRAKAKIVSGIHGSKSLSEREKSEVLSRLVTPSSIDALLDDQSSNEKMGMMIEAVVEDINVKKKIFQSAASQLELGAILASNTSSLSISELAKEVPEPTRVIGVHFFNPAEKLPLVELVRGKETSDAVTFACAAFAVKLGKFPIIVNDVPGFLVNRILTPYLNAAAHLAILGYPLEEIDQVAVNFGLPMGPFRLLDEIGLDVAFHVGQTMENGYGPRMAPPPLVRRLLDKGRKGRKEGGGFYDYPDGQKPEPFPSILRTLEILESPRSLNSDEELIKGSLIGSMISEAVRAFDEGVAGTPSFDAGRQIDLGSVMGFGFPAFHGGILRYAQMQGAKDLHAHLEKVHQMYPIIPTFYEGIAERSRSGRSFYESKEE